MLTIYDLDQQQRDRERAKARSLVTENERLRAQNAELRAIARVILETPDIKRTEARS